MNPLTRTIVEIAVVLAVGIALGWMINGWRLNSKMESIKTQYSEAELAAYQKAIKAMTTDLSAMRDAAQGARVKTLDIERGMQNIAKELKNAKPLPNDCRPDDFRMRKLSEAVAALQATLSGRVPLPAMPDTERPD